MPLRSDKVEAAARTLILLEELNRHRVVSIDVLHHATGLPKSTIVLADEIALRHGLRRQRPAPGRLFGSLPGSNRLSKRLSRRSVGGGSGPPHGRWPSRRNITGRSLSPSSTARRSWSGFSTIPGQPGFHRFMAPSTCASACFVARLDGPISRSVPPTNVRCCSTCWRGRTTPKIGRSPTAGASRRCSARYASWAMPNATRWSSRDRPETIAAPIIDHGKVLATVGMTYFISALDRRDLVERYAPLVQILAENISSSVRSLRVNQVAVLCRLTPLSKIPSDRRP